MKNIIKIFIPNETSANSVGANSLYQVISKLINDENISSGTIEYIPDTDYAGLIDAVDDSSREPPWR